MPDGRLKRTREAYPDDTPLTLREIYDAIKSFMPPIHDKMEAVTDDKGVTHMRRVPQKFEVLPTSLPWPKDDDDARQE